MPPCHEPPLPSPFLFFPFRAQGRGRQSSGEEEGGVGAAGADRDRNAGNNNTDDGGPFSWREGELEGLALHTERGGGGGGLVIVAADVIYDEGLTEAFFQVLKLLMPVSPPPPPAHESLGDGGGCGGVSDSASGGEMGLNHACAVRSASVHPAAAAAAASASAPSSSREKPTADGNGSSGVAGVRGKGRTVLYLALEKRFNFSLAELSVKAAGYNALLRNVLDVTQTKTNADDAKSFAHGKIGAEKSFEGRRLPLSFQQCFHYQRSEAMELWEIWRRPEEHGKT